MRNFSASKYFLAHRLGQNRPLGLSQWWCVRRARRLHPRVKLVDSLCVSIIHGAYMLGGGRKRERVRDTFSRIQRYVMHRWPRPVALVMFDKGGQSPADLARARSQKGQVAREGLELRRRRHPATLPRRARGATDTTPQPVSFTRALLFRGKQRINCGGKMWFSREM